MWLCVQVAGSLRTRMPLESKALDPPFPSHTTYISCICAIHFVCMDIHAVWGLVALTCFCSTALDFLDQLAKKQIVPKVDVSNLEGFFG